MMAIDRTFRNQIMDMVDTHTQGMAPEQAIEFLDELGADIDGRIEALRDENEL
jgi:hypothetical protein